MTDFQVGQKVEAQDQEYLFRGTIVNVLEKGWYSVQVKTWRHSQGKWMSAPLFYGNLPKKMVHGQYIELITS